MKCTMHGKYLVTILAMAGFMAGLLSPAQAAPPEGVVACGDILEGGEFIMTKDLSCSQDPALQVIGPATLDMKGHTLECDGGDTGILVLGTRAMVSNGTITKCGDNGVNVCSGTVCVDQDFDEVPGEGNHRISGLTITDSGDDGMDVDSNNNQIVNNTVTGSPDKGILIDADTHGNQVILNYVTDNNIGIETDVGATDNILHANSATGNASVDLLDDGLCDNDWSDNIFGTSNPPGVGCIN